MPFLNERAPPGRLRGPGGAGPSLLGPAIEPSGTPARFERRVGDNQHPVVYLSCGAVTDVDCAVGEPPCVLPSDASGFVIDEAEVTLWGRCPTCQTTSKTKENEIVT